MNELFFSWSRLFAVIYKEFIQMRRDATTLGMIIGIPIIQLLLFGFAINSNPHHLPTAILSADNSNFTRAFIYGLANTKYFSIDRILTSEAEARQVLALGTEQFVLKIPENFTRDLVRGLHPNMLLMADATDTVATGQALASIPGLVHDVFNSELTGSLKHLQVSALPASVIIHAEYNPELITQYNIVPGLMGVVLTMTMVMITSLAITRERERGTMENLLAMPVLPLEVMLGKVVPYIVVGYLQVIIILIFARIIFHVPFLGSLTLLLFSVLPFIAANLTVGLTFSTIAKNQLQAIQMAFFFFLPSVLLSGFMFPFRGMPEWAQWIGTCLPLTHFLRISHGIMLKGNTLSQIQIEIWPLLTFTVIVILLGFKRFRRTLD